MARRPNFSNIISRVCSSLDFAVGNHLEVLEYLHVALVGVQDNVEVFIGAEHFSENVAERLFQHADHCGLVDVLEFLELGELLDHIGSFLFLCHYIVFYIFIRI